MVRESQKQVKNNINITQVSHDHRSLSNCEQKPEKVRTSTGFEPVTSRYRCDALTAVQYMKTFHISLHINITVRRNLSTTGTGHDAPKI